MHMEFADLAASKDQEISHANEILGLVFSSIKVTKIHS